MAGDIDATDVEGLTDSTYFSVTTPATNGTAVIDAETGVWTFMPTDANWFGSDSFEVTVTDDLGGTTTQIANITLANVDDAPVIAPAQSFSIAENANNTDSLGTVSASDADTGTAYQNWTITSGNKDGIFQIDSNTGELTILDNTNLDRETSASYVLGLTVSDGVKTSAVETVTIHITDVNDNAPIIISDGGDLTIIANIDENTTAVTDVDAIDADGTTPTYGFGGGTDDGFFTIDNTSGVLSFIAAPDFESTADADGDNAYEVIVEARDAVNTTAQAISVIVNNLNETPPQINDALASVAEVAANTTLVYDVNDANTTTDTDAEDNPITYTLSAGNADGIFAIDSATGQITLADNSSLAFANTSQYTLTVEASDGIHTDAATLTIDVIPSNVPPVVDSLLTPTDPRASDDPEQVPNRGETILSDSSADSVEETMLTDSSSDDDRLPIRPSRAGLIPPAQSVSAQSSVQPSPEAQLEVVPILETSAEEVSEPPVHEVQREDLVEVKQIIGDQTSETSTSLISNRRFVKALDSMSLNIEKEIQSELHKQMLIGQSVKGVGIGLSAGVLTWLARGGALLSSLLATLPAWRSFDALPVLAVSAKERAARKHAVHAAEKEEALNQMELIGIMGSLKRSAAQQKPGAGLQ